MWASEDCIVCGTNTEDYQWCEICGNPVCWNCYKISSVNGKLVCNDCKVKEANDADKD